MPPPVFPVTWTAAPDVLPEIVTLPEFPVTLSRPLTVSGCVHAGVAPTATGALLPETVTPPRIVVSQSSSWAGKPPLAGGLPVVLLTVTELMAPPPSTAIHAAELLLRALAIAEPWS